MGSLGRPPTREAAVTCGLAYCLPDCGGALAALGGDELTTNPPARPGVGGSIARRSRARLLLDLLPWILVLGFLVSGPCEPAKDAAAAPREAPRRTG